MLRPLPRSLPHWFLPTPFIQLYVSSSARNSTSLISTIPIYSTSCFVLCKAFYLTDFCLPNLFNFMLRPVQGILPVKCLCSRFIQVWITVRHKRSVVCVAQWFWLLWFDVWRFHPGTAFAIFGLHSSTPPPHPHYKSVYRFETHYTIKGTSAIEIMHLSL